ncbi:DUF4291 domain-containing protein [Dactylosporangium siamense]|uniref:DUF4291 domain-containing protein n=1 Tax=Dactylosporangium siamense TaxID=685454 RepID=A0A919PGF2_9ACTN|nr:DUF4291 domain-containing protein [Dactylosporangium siamense]GIG42902.1 hypothetical protein Dsi01nite_009430 [Dactylosporangium siamense]
MPVPYQEIRAVHDDETITVYQAYSPAIAVPAVAAQRFVPPFKRDRMTWVKPSFLWMMYRSGWAMKEGQEHVLAVRLRRAGFDAAVAGACLSHYSPAVHASRADWSRRLRISPVRVQWDPERSLQLQPLGHRSLQLGLSGDAVHRYVDDWTVSISDVTPLAHEIHALVRARSLDEAQALLPAERPYQPVTIT